MKDLVGQELETRLVILSNGYFDVGPTYTFHADGRAGTGLSDEEGQWHVAPWEPSDTEDDNTAATRLKYLRTEDAGRWKIIGILGFHKTSVVAEVIKA